MAHAPWREAPGSRPACPPCVVGVHPWWMPEPALSVFVRATLPLGATTPAFVEPTPLSVGEAPDRPDDFIPLRPALDLVLTGLVDMAGVPQGGVFVRRAAISIGEAREELLIASGAPGRVPLAPPYTRWLDGSEARLGPRPLTSAVPADGIHPDGFDFDAYQIGADRLQFDGMPAGEPLVLQGFFAEGDRVETLLPDLAPRLLVDLAEPGLEPRDVVLRLDTAHVDCDRRVVDLTWRGLLALEGEVRAATDRLIVGWVRPTEWDDSRVASHWRDILRELPRGRFFWATEQGDVARGVAPPDLTEEEALMARYQSWDQVAGPLATLPLERRARIAAELAEQREPREGVLLRHGLDEHGWSLEERATLDELSAPAATPAEARAQQAYAEAYREAQASLATPVEDSITVQQLARLIALAEDGRHEPALRELGLGLGALLRLEQRFRREADASPDAARALDAALEAAREEAASSPRPEVSEVPS
ncbi:MAG: DUF2169 domain-containing protein [Polyangiaceae bacterium]|nr:DUF2169 domain-containing protein [Polyangiaceae bacterium]MBK8939869.1 DUF2169 domain-containing protein [Polyangiaceae bacterium]